MALPRAGSAAFWLSMVLLLGWLPRAWALHPDQHFITIGTGGVTGVYYPAGGAICRLVNKARRHNGIRCSVESTEGSVYNLRALRAGDLDFAIVQSDLQYDALKGTGVFHKSGPFKRLRAVFSLYPEPLTIVARKDSGIRSFADLRGKRVNIGSPGSGQRATMKILMAKMGWTMKDFASAGALRSADLPDALCDDRIDAFVFTVGHPNGTVKEATTACPSVLVGVDNAAVRRLVRDNPFYSMAVIPGGMYRGNPRDVTTFGVRATLVTTTDEPESVVYGLVKAVFSNFQDFRELHPAFQGLRKARMVSDGLSAPLDPGALKYYRQAGLR